MATRQDMNRNPLGNGGWKRGQSGNPGGRPKNTPDFLKQARAEGTASLQTLVELRDNPDIDPQIRRQCANDILDRAYGKPVQQMETDSNFRAYLIVPDRKSLEAVDTPLIDLAPEHLENEPEDPL